MRYQIARSTLTSMTDNEFKVRENRVRRAVARRGFALEKARRKDPQAWDFATYHVIDPRARVVIVYGHDPRGAFGMTLDDVEQWLADTAKGEGNAS